MFARNQWYVAAWSRDLKREPLARLICGEPVVVYRGEDDRPIAMEDACPHRLLPLSMGLVEGNAIRCKYHGLLLGPDGRCRELPGRDAPNRAVSVATYPVIERYNFVWVWIGDAAKADATPLTDLWMCEHAQWRVGGGTYEVACDYRLLIDNLMDLSHEQLVHASSIGQKELHEVPITTTVEGDKVVTSRWMPGVPPPPLYRRALGDYDGMVDRWQICEYRPPTGVVIDVGVAKVGRGATLDRHEENDMRSFVINFVTPATERTCTYFWGNSRKVPADDPTFDEYTRLQGQVFLEDVEILQAQQRSIDLQPQRKLRAFGIDSGGVRARLMLERLLRDAATT